MSTAAVSSLSIFQELQSFYQTRQADVKQLGSALQSGDLNGAQQAYANLAALGQGGPFANSEPFTTSRGKDFEAIGRDLQSGDLAGAQAAFAALTSKQRDAAASSQATPAAVVNLTSTQPSSAAPATASGGPAASIYEQLQAYRQQRQADLTQLGQDLQSGNLNAAQQDFTTLTALGQTGPNKNGQTFGRTDRNQDFQAIGQALESGDLAGAQSAFATLEKALAKPSEQSQTAIATYNSGALSVSA
jgi:Skp family chaperone for outer membrane proteins